MPRQISNSRINYDTMTIRYQGEDIPLELYTDVNYQRRQIRKIIDEFAKCMVKRNVKLNDYNYRLQNFNAEGESFR